MYQGFTTPEALLAHYAAVKARINRPVPIVPRKPEPAPVEPIVVVAAPVPDPLPEQLAAYREVAIKPPFEAYKTAQAILEHISREYHVPALVLLGPSRMKIVGKARARAYYLLRMQLKWSLPRIGDFMGGKDHTTVLRGIRRFHERLACGEETL